MKKIFAAILVAVSFSSVFAFGADGHDFTYADYEMWCFEHSHGREFYADYEDYRMLVSQPQCLICPVCDVDDYYVEG